MEVTLNQHKVKRLPKPWEQEKAEFQRLFEAIAATSTVKGAALKLGISPRAAYNLLYKLRNKYVKARKIVNFVDSQKRRDKRIRMVLTDRVVAAEFEAEVAEAKEQRIKVESFMAQTQREDQQKAGARAEPW